jgi:hypothetical protein
MRRKRNRQSEGEQGFRIIAEAKRFLALGSQAKTIPVFLKVHKRLSS